MAIEGLPLVELTSAGVADVAQYSNLQNANKVLDTSAPTTENIWIPLSVVRRKLSTWVRANDKTPVEMVGNVYWIHPFPYLIGFMCAYRRLKTTSMTLFRTWRAQTRRLMRFGWRWPTVLVQIEFSPI